MIVLRKLLATCALSLAGLCFVQPAMADVRIDIKNDTTDSCSVALNARIDKTKWMTVGWYVFLAGEEAPIILKDATDIHDVFIYHDCDMQKGDNDEIKEGWIKTNLKFTDYIPMEKEKGYEKVEFVRLNSNTYTITQG